MYVWKKQSLTIKICIHRLKTDAIISLKVVNRSKRSLEVLLQIVGKEPDIQISEVSVVLKKLKNGKYFDIDKITTKILIQTTRKQK